MTRPVILDCDPGVDDAMAILLARGCPDVELRAITTVAGNQTLAKTTLNARRVCTVARITDVPIYAGCDRPLVRPQATGAAIHGESGLDGPVFGEPSVDAEDEHAVDFLVRTLMASSGDITLVPVGPLTNIATALRREPRIARKTREVVLMGGSYTRGNVTPAAEFNIHADPEAAAAVFSAGWPVTMVGLDLTHQAGAPQHVVDELAGLPGPVGEMAAAMLAFFRGSYRRVRGHCDPPVHDPCAVARVARPDLVAVEDAFVAVETRGELTAGMTVTDFASSAPNAKVATRLDAGGFWSLVVEAVKAVDAAA